MYKVSVNCRGAVVSRNFSIKIPSNVAKIMANTFVWRSRFAFWLKWIFRSPRVLRRLQSRWMDVEGVANWFTGIIIFTVISISNYYYETRDWFDLKERISRCYCFTSRQRRERTASGTGRHETRKLIGLLSAADLRLCRRLENGVEKIITRIVSWRFSSYS